MSEYVQECTRIALRSVEALKEKGHVATHVEVSTDVLGLMSCGGIDINPGTFLGLPQIERQDLRKHIRAVAKTPEGEHRSPWSAENEPKSLIHQVDPDNSSLACRDASPPSL